VSTTDATRHLGEPLLTSPGQPLRVAVYSRISQAIRSGTFTSGGLLPRETELGKALGVSRTVVREALMLLEEDGLITTKRGVGRFVADLTVHPGLDEFQPLEMLLAAPGAVLEVVRLEFSLQKVTDFVSDHLNLDPSEEFWFSECIANRDGQPVALLQEYVPNEQRLAALHGPLAVQLRESAEASSTLLQALIHQVGPVFRPGICRIAASVAGPTRAGLLGVKASDPLLVITQTATIEGVPAYISKCVLPPAFGHLSVAQWKPDYVL
jgi:GntR family transcriptional regulator